MKQYYAKYKPQKKALRKAPRKETVDFILNYSKALKVERCGKVTIEMILN